MLQIAILTIVSIFLLLLACTFAAHRVLFPGVPAVEVATYPLVTVAAQLLSYVVVLAFMVLIVKRRANPGFWRAIRWSWPSNWVGFLLGGIVLALSLQGLAHLLPIPKELPMDKFFQTTMEAWIMSIFGITIAPLMEELFFRGFLYPVLQRRLGVVVAIVLTGLAFSFIHAPQLGRAWGPVLLILIVGLVLTTVRAITKSVAAGLLVHMAYNGAITVLIFVATDGFRHLDKLNR